MSRRKRIKSMSHDGQKNNLVNNLAGLSLDELQALSKAFPSILQSKLQSSLQSSNLEDVMAANLFLEKSRSIDDQVKSIFYLPDHVAYSGRGYKDNLGRVSFELLQRMGNLYCVKNIITTRIEQVMRFLRFSTDEQKEGYTIRRKRSLFSSKDESKDLSDKDKKEIERIVNFIERGGAVSKWDGGDTLITFVKKILFDSLSLDQLAFEIVRTRGFELNKFKAVDASMIRILDADDPQYSQDFEKYRYRGYLPKYCQVWDQQIVYNKFKKEYVLYYPWELGYGVRNQSTNIYDNGYGKSELESLSEIITYVLNSVQYNGNFFKNGSNPKGFLNIKDSTANQTQLNEFKQHWRQLLTGTQNSHKIPVFQGLNVEWIDLHHCLHPDSKVLTKAGRSTLGELLHGNNEVYTEIWDGTSFEKAKVFKTGKKHLCRTNFLNRCSIQTSDNHKFLVLRGDNPEWVKQSDLKVGDFVFVNKNISHGTMTDLTFNGRVVDDDLFEMFGWILGDGYIGDGTPSHKFFKLFYHPNKEDDVIQRHIETCHKYGINVRYYLVKTHKNHIGKTCSPFQQQLVICDHKLYNFFRELGFTVSKEGKSIPPIIYACRPSYRKALLRGLFSADGHVGRSDGNIISLAITQKKLKADVIDLLLTLGVRCNSFVSKSYPDSISNNTDVVLLIKDKRLFMKEIGFLQSYKNDSFHGGVRSPYLIDEAPISFIRSFAKKLRIFYKKLPVEMQVLKKIERHDLQNISGGHQKSSLSKVLFYAEKMAYPIPDFLRNFNLTKIISIERTDEFVEMVDVEMFNKSHQFIANGVVVHNSNREMEFDNWTKFLIVLTCSVYRIDPSELGFQFRDSSNTLGQYGQKERLDHSKQKGLYPILVFLQSVFNHYLIEELNEDFELVFTGMEVEDEEKQVKLDKEKIEMGAVSMEDMFKKYSGRDFDPETDTILNSVYQQAQQAKMYGGETMNNIVEEETGEEGMPNPFNEDSMKSMVSENPIMRDALSYINAQFEM